MPNEKLTSKIEILEDGKIQAIYDGETVYLQPMVYVDTYQSTERIIIKSSPFDEDWIRVDTSISEIDGVSFSGTFAQLETAIRNAAKKANSSFVGTDATGGGGAVGNIISTSNSTSSILGAGATFTGSWEDVTDYTTVAVAILGSIATDGTLYFDLSTDAGATFTSVPSSIGDTTFAVPRILNVVETHVRIRYINGSTPMTGTFSLQTKYSNGQELALLSSVNGFVNNETPVNVVKSVIAGELLDGNLNDTGVFDNVSLLSNKALKTAIPPSILYQKSRPTDPVLPSGAAVVVDPVLNVEPNVLDSGWMSTASFGGGSLIHIVSDADLSIYVMNASDSSGNNIQGDSVPTLLVITGSPAVIGAPFFDNYVRILIENTSGSSANAYSITMNGQQTPAPPVFTSIEQDIFGFYPAPISRTVSVGKNPNGEYLNTPASSISNSLSTNTPLGISGNFTSPWVSVEQFAEIKLAMETDVPSASCLIQLSHDGVNIHTSLSLPPQFIASASKYGFIHSLNPSLPYFRINYTNGAVAQTSFEFSTILLVQSGNGFVSRAVQVLNRYTDVKNVRVVNAAEQDRNFDLINYQEAKRKFGTNQVVGATSETIAPDGSGVQFATAIETIRIKAGGNVNDTAAGSGAQKVFIEALDSNGDEVLIELDTAGASASLPSGVTISAVNSAYTKGVNAGNIVIENTTSNEVLAFIETGLARTRQSLYTVPNNKTMWITALYPSVGEGDSADITLFHYRNVDGLETKLYEWGVSGFIGSTPIKRETFLKIDSGGKLVGEAIKVSGGGGGARVGLDFDFILTDNTL